MALTTASSLLLLKEKVAAPIILHPVDQDLFNTFKIFHACMLSLFN
jgi:hypothetical protein